MALDGRSAGRTEWCRQRLSSGQSGGAADRLHSPRPCRYGVRGEARSPGAGGAPLTTRQRWSALEAASTSPAPPTGSRPSTRCRRRTTDRPAVRPVSGMAAGAGRLGLVTVRRQRQGIGAWRAAVHAGCGRLGGPAASRRLLGFTQSWVLRFLLI